MVELVLVSTTLFAFGVVSRRLDGSPVTAPMVFTSVGLLVGGAGLGWFDLELRGEGASILIEATLVLVLFSDAVRIDLGALGSYAGIPTRLLVTGLPLTIVAGAAVAAVTFDDLSFTEAALLAAVLAPTDAALGQAVVSDERLPVRIRQGLNVESGLNDGIAVPIVTVLLTLADTAAEAGAAGGWPGFLAAQIGLGLLAGVLAGGIGGLVLDAMTRRGAVQGAWRQIATLAVAALAYSAAELVGGNGFVSAFVAGLAFDRAVGEACREDSDFTVDEAELLTSVTFLVFGAVLAGPLLGGLTPAVALYAVLSLTVIRMVPVLVAMIGSETRIESRLFLGWFGPRGLASILFTLLVVEELASAGADTVVTVAAWTILLSVYAHGISAGPWAARLARVLGASPAGQPELGPGPEMPTRRRLTPPARLRD